MRLEDWRKREGLSYQELADRLGVARATAYRLCKRSDRRAPPPDLMERIVSETRGRVRPEDFYQLAEAS